MNTTIVNLMLRDRLVHTLYGCGSTVSYNMLPVLNTPTQHYSDVSTFNYNAKDDAFGSGFPEQTTVYPLLRYAVTQYITYNALKNKIALYENAHTNNGHGLVVYREEVWSLILEKAVQSVIPFLEEHLEKALMNMNVTLDSIMCLEDDNEEMVEWTVNTRKFMHNLIKRMTEISESLTCTSWDDRIQILELYADLKLYTQYQQHRDKQDSYSDGWNQDALLLLRYRFRCGITKALEPLLGWRNWGGDALHHNHAEALDSIIRYAYSEVIEEENKATILGAVVLQDNINHFIQTQIVQFKDDLLVASFKQVQNLTVVVNKLCEKLQIAGQVLSF